MSLHVLPERTGGAAENMATDFLLLQRYGDESAPRFRHYGWRAPAFTFGYGQKIAFVRSRIPEGERFDLCRRPTGGGVVDHRDDWTYALVIPRGHDLEKERASRSYAAVHACVAAALVAQGVPAVLETRETEMGDGGEAGVCFQRAEVGDVVDGRTGAKIAGAAQKRNRHGILFQGSVWCPAAGGDAVDWERFGEDLAAGIAAALGTSPQTTPWPEFNEGEVDGLVESYSSTEWLELR